MKVEIWSDIGCPFCYIGKKNFEAGVSEFAGKDDLEVIYRSFQLDPTAKKEPDESMAELLAKKYNKSVKEAEIMNSQVADAAKAAGLDFNMEKVVPSNSMDAHRLVKLASEEGKEGEAMNRLYKAYFTDGLNVADTETLVQIGTEIGLDSDKIRAMLSDDLYKEKVIEDQNVANQLGAQGVPLFVINRKYGVSGAQPPEAFKEALTKAYEE
ncbi:DsbA family oxidoreductase [Salinicoccus halodurans]|uniref:DSBA oxidoreductase n=1 Tax=Salinicoccus halodurans TaxID=407035 RepID=A0A0F7HKB7_9STAP|nr:DsbA family oxidoreductase [Salinicoccus halodurans]AKG73138.1 DSBA oxidoreductase [Salinicoccus halodurans]SFK84982.1 Predicted dithiol-disulfide isomerase, DsbA family [Salinicoccus halodurans]